MCTLRLTLMFLLLSTPVLAKDLNREVEELKLKVSEQEDTITLLKAKVNQLENLQEEHEALLKKLLVLIYEKKQSGRDHLRAPVVTP